MNKNHIEDIYQLSPMQQGMLFHSLYAPEHPEYIVQLNFSLHGHLNVRAFEQAWQELVARHSALRCAFYWQGQNKPLQVVYRQVKLPVLIYSWLGLDPHEQQQKLEAFLQSDRQRGFQLSEAPLMRLTLIQMEQEVYQFVWTFHHILIDGWSLALMLKEVVTLYEAFRQGQDLHLQPSRAYREYIVWLQQQNLAKAEEFWRSLLKDLTAPTPLVVDRASLNLSDESERYGEEQILLSVAATAALQSFTRQHQLTVSTLVQGAWALLLSRYSGETDVMFGVVVSGRPPTIIGVESIIGLLINTLPMRVMISNNDSVLSWLKLLQHQQVEMSHYDYSPLVEIQGWSEVPRGVALFESIVAFENYPVDAALEKGILNLDLSNLRAYDRTHYPLTLIAVPGAQLCLRLSYNSRRFDAATISRMLGHLQTLLLGMSNNPEQRLLALPLVTEPEQQLLFEWNNTQVEYPQNVCIHQLFEAQMERIPDAVALVFEDQHLTYRELNERANQLAHYLQSIGIGPEVLVGLCVERSVEMIVGMLGILKAGGVYVPLDPAYPQQRLVYILSDAKVSVLLTQQHLVEKFSQHSVKVVCLDTDAQAIAQQSQQNPETEVTTPNLAYVIYTSGSTGKPKGVLIAHSGLCNLAWAHKKNVDVRDSSHILQFASLSFDASIWEVVMAITTASTLYLGTTDSLRPGKELIDLLRQYQMTHVTLPPSALAVLPTAELRALQTIVVAGEACSEALVAQWAKGRKFFNAYGPTEATVCATVLECTINTGKPSIGRPIVNTRVYVLDEHLQPVPIGVPGELYISGDGLARGYLNRPETTAEKFLPNPFSSKPGTRLYKTGDLARYLPDSNIEFLGRIDNQVKIRGFRIELGEIEAALTQHPQVRETVVIAGEDILDTKRIIAYIVPLTESRPTISELSAFLKQKLPEYMVPASIVILDAMPLTPNGKVDRKVLPAPDASRTHLSEAYVAPRSPVQEILVSLWAEILGQELVGIHDNFFELGGHSLLATQLISRVRDVLQLELPLRYLFESPTPAQLAESIAQIQSENSAVESSVIEPVARNTELPLSFAQARLWFLDQLMPGNPFYNMPFALRLAGELDVLALQQSLQEIIRRHETLRTCFLAVNGQPTQQIVSSIELTVAVLDLQSLPKIEREHKARKLASEMAQQTFDLTVAPLMRVMLLRLAPTEHVLLLVMHHIISDGWSIGVFHRELTVLYDTFVTGITSPLPELSIQYADFAVWQSTWLEQTSLKNQLLYWKQQLAELAVLQLPTDYPRPAVQSFRGAIQILELPLNLKQGLVKLSQQHGVTLFMTMLAAFKVLLYRYTGQTDIVVGSPIANRNRSEIEPLIGFFVNTLVLRTQVQGNLCFSELLKLVRSVTLGAYAHQDLPFERLVEELQPERSLDSNPLVQVMFAAQNAPMEELQLTGLQLSRLELEYNTTRLDMEWHVWEQPQGLQVMLAYATDLFAQQTIKRMLGHFQTLLEGVVANPQQQIWQLPLLSATQQQQLLFDWNDTQTEYPHHKCIHQLFETQVEQTPDAVALVFEDQQLTYNELNERANQLAHYLQSIGIGPEVLVGLCVARSIEMVVGMLAILKARGAYVPIDPNYPQQRVAFILSDAKVSVLLTQQHLVEKFSQHSVKVVCLDTDAQAIAQQSQQNPETEVTTPNLAYVIYTSGSTGKPKGVLIAHSGLCNLAWAHKKNVNVRDSSHILQFASLSFDASIWEVVMAITTASTLYLGTTDSLRPGKELIDLLRQYQMTHVTLPPSALAVLPTSELRALQTIVVAGEACSEALVAQWAKGRKFFNAYGPTEATVCAMVAKCTINTGKPSIGRPIVNTQVYLLDEHLQPVPIGVPGELYISGDGLARGYLNRPETTAEKFLPNPFSKQLGTRLYKTGDRARYNSNGNIEFLGRIDNQVKLRGYRIELGEIESMLNQYPQVQQAVAIVREDNPGHQRIVAYCTQDLSHPLETTVEPTQLPTEHVNQWQTLYDQTYAQPSQESEATFNIVGWNSSYTNQPIPSEQMRQWLAGRVNHLLAFQPQRVLEIGCGTGLLLFQIAPHCEHYYGTDFSPVALASIAQQLRHPEWHLPQVQLQQKLADDFEGVEPGSFDTVILNSVVQYFPSIDYLLKVLVGAVKAVAPGGIVFVGDVRSLPLLKAFHTSVQLYQAEDKLSIQKLQQRVQTQVAEETELVIEPEFFLALKQTIPQITNVQIRLQRGEYHNELSCFRYDVTLHVEDGKSIPESPLLWHEWEKENLTIERTAQLLESQPAQLGIVNIPNARVLSAIKTIELLSSTESGFSIPQLRTTINSRTAESGVEPEQLWNMAQAHGYILAISWSETELGCYDVLFSRQSTDIVHKPRGGATPLERKKVQPIAWQHYANNPLQTQQNRQLQLELHSYLSARLPEYMVPSAIVMLSSLPLTPNGKVARQALPSPEASRSHLSETYVAPRSPVEEILVSLWAEILGLLQVGIHDNFFDLGGHSLLGTQLISRVRDVLQLELPLRYLFESPTPAQLAESIAQIQSENSAVESDAIEPVARNTELPLSFAQARLWFLDQLTPQNPFYNMPSALRLAGELDVLALQQSLNKIIRRHETLRTCFQTVNGQPTQQILSSIELTVAVIDLQSLPTFEREHEAREWASEMAQQPFDLTVAPLMRVMLLRLAPTEHVLLLVMHHIISDGWSVGVFHRELAFLYNAFVTGITSPLPELNIQYADFAVWQRTWLEQTTLKNQLLYWKQRLANLAVLQLPTDYPRPAVQSFRGAVEILELPLNLKQGLVKLSQQHGVTLFMTLLAAFKVLLHRYTGQTDIVVGSPIANRNRSEIEPLIGFFVNTLVLRTQVQGNLCFSELLNQVRSVTLGAYAHQDLPFERLVEELQPERSLNTNPLFQVMFALQNAPMEELQLTGLQLSRQELEYNTTRCDMEWHVWEQSQGLQVMVAYATDLFAQQTIKRMFGHFQTLLNSVVTNPQHQIFELPLMSTTQQQQLLFDWNDTQTEYPHHKCIHQLFETQVERTPDAVALVFEDQQLTYNELNERANQLAHYLQSIGIGPEVLVGLCVERSVEMIVGMLGILKAGGAYVPLDPAYPQQRLVYILSDAKVSVLLTQQHLVEKFSQHSVKVVCLDTDAQAIAQQSQQNPETEVTTPNLAYVIYTSGSTGKPKGVLIAHSGLCNLAWAHKKNVDVRDSSHILQFASLSFDASIWEVVMGITTGATLYLGTTNSLRPGKELIELLRQYQITQVFLPPSALAVLPTSELKALQTILVGGEACSEALVLQWALERKFFNAYGPTEATVCATVLECTINTGKPSIGRPIANTQVYVLDKQLQPVPMGVRGELYISGDGLARGYLNRPETTAEKFLPNPFSSKPGTRLYKTGDLARYLPDSNIEFLGRIDNQVKIRGFRIELGEIEAALTQHPQVRETVVIAGEDILDTKRIIAYIVPLTESRPTISELSAFLKQKLPEYMVPASIVILDAMPLTPNGKVDRKVLPAPDASRTHLSEAYVAPRSPVQEILVSLWAEILGQELVGIHDNFFELGGHSLLATQLISRVRDVLQLELPLRYLFESPTPAQLAESIAQIQSENSAVESSVIEPVARNTELPLSFAQARLWFLDQLMPGNPFYNMPFALRLAGELDVLALQQSLQEIIRRHETLRTCFLAVNGQPTQQIVSSIELTVAVLDLQSLPKIEREHKARKLASEMAQQTFDLTVAPLMRVMLLRLAPTEHVLLLVMHHIISDGWSIGVFHRELTVLYDTFVTGITSPLPELSIQYADFAVWQSTWLEQTSLKNQLLYWKQQLAELAVLQLPTDYPRPAVQSFRGAIQILELPLNLKQGLVKLSQQHGVTLFMTMLAAFKVLLYRYTGQTDIVVGSPIANRNRSEIEPLIGFFVNTLVLRTQVQGNLCFSELLKLVRSVTLGAYAHQDLPFERLVEELQPERSLDSNPLVQVMFAAQNAPMEELQLTGLQLSRLELEYNTTRLDMEWHVWEQPQGLQVMLAYATDLFAQQTIKRMLGHFQTLLEGVVANPQQQIWQLPLLSATQQQQLLFDWNDTQTEYPHHKCIHQLFETQVEQTPDAVALVFEDQQLTYNELNERANQLAHYLQSIGIGPEVLVGLCVARSIEMVVGMLAILKARGAYVPIDPNYPQQRVAFILSDARVSVLLTQQKLVAELPSHGASIVCLDTDKQIIAQQSQKNPASPVTASSLAYVLYTSGSTGRPKGVTIAHRSTVSLLAWAKQVYSLHQLAGVLAATSICFDLSVFELFVPLCWGGKAIIAENALYLPTILAANNVTLVNTVPSAMIELLKMDGVPDSVGTINLAGEPLQNKLVQQIYERKTVEQVFNLYGPSEDTTYSTFIQVEKLGKTNPPIGRPVANTQVYLLDEHLQPVPMGVPGELYTSGDGLARGYLNRPETTAEKFLPNPFSNQLGTRLYKTGDRARYNSNGNIEFLGRIDNQVKLRGYRIELGEIESMLNQYPQVQQAVAIVREDNPGHQRIVAYCTQDLSHPLETTVEPTQLPTEHVNQWQTLYDQTYAQPSQESEATFNIVGWNSSYTNQPIPSEQMRQWLAGRVNHLLAFQPQRVLEIGCGTGLLLFQIAPHCEHYYGTDFSPVALASIAQQLRHPEWHLPQVQLQQKLADDFEGVEPGSFDTVILNSVVQYFPSIDYLLKVLVGAVKAVAPGGIVFVGDVRSLPLLKAFHTSVQLYQAEDKLSIQKLQQRVQTQVAEETELVIEPEFFLALKQTIPQITNVQIRLQRGEYHNELSCFRYDVTLHVEDGKSIPESPLLWHEWEKENLTIERTAQLLESQPAQLGIVNIPNARVLSAIKTIELLSSTESGFSIPQLRTTINSRTAESGVEPEQLWNMAQAHGYILAISWSETELGCYDVLFSRQSTDIVHKPRGGATPLERKKVQPIAWQHYANNPLQTQQNRQLQLELHSYLSARLPEYMVPSAIVMLSSLPLTPNGKVARQALPSPEASRSHLSETYVAPRSPVEEILVSLWAEILGLLQVGIHDNFFDLGGHSLLGTQLISRVRDVLQLELPLRYLFESPTPAQLAESIAQIQSENSAVESDAIEPVARNTELPLSFAQARLWFLDQLTPQNPFYNMPSALRLAGELDVLALQQSLNKIIRRHETLRTCFQTVNGQPTQQILSSIELTVAVIDLQSLPTFEREHKAREWASEMAQQPFDLTVAPLMRVMLLRLAPTEHVLLLVMHHIISDGWSVGVFHRELAFLYNAFVTGITSPLPELNIQYADFAVWQRTWLEQTTLKNQLLYWKQRLANLAVLQLPTDYPRPAVQSFRGAVEILELPLNLKQGLVKLSQQHGVTLFMTLLAAFKVLLHRYTGQTDIVVGSPIANRNRSEIEPLIGFFVNTLVLRTQVQGNLCFSELLNQVRSVTLGAYAHQDLPFERLVEELQPERSLNTNPLFQVMFALQNAPMEELQLTGLQLSRQELEYNTTRCDMEWHVWEQSQGLQVMVAYATDLFAQQTVKRMFGHFQTLLSGVVANPQQQIWELPLMSTTQQQQLLFEWNDTQTEYPHHKCIHELFEAQVKRTPDAVALVFEDQQLTYNELNVHSNQLAHYLKTLGVKPDVAVGICVQRSLEMVVGVLGILKAGGAYVPLDPAYPTERLSYMLSNSQVKVLLTSENLVSALPEHNAQVVCLDTQWKAIAQERDKNLVSGVQPENLAYVIYTSGSTGLPKGVAMPQLSLTNLILWQLESSHVLSYAKTLQFSPISFDVSFQEMFSTWCCGGTLVLIAEELRRDATLLLDFLKHKAIERLFLPFVALQQLAQVAAHSDALPSALREIITAGEQLQITRSVRDLFSQLPNCRLNNHYGPSESHVVTALTLSDFIENWSELPPIGRPIANTHIYILDQNFQPVPIGVPGELYIGGVALARGYLNRPELSAEKFIPNPFSDKPGRRLYKTGDQVRYLRDGNIEFLGRIDNQVKIRGFRIELGEIEAVFTQHPQVQETVVIAGEDISGTKRLIAYMVPSQESIPTISELRVFLKQKLPEYMVPTSIVMLSSLPLTPSGKVDRKALPAPEREQQNAFVAPRDLLERQLAQVWEKVLNTKPIGVKDNFFDLGGHSLLAVSLIAKIQKQCGQSLPLTALFQAPTIEQLASVLRQQISFPSWSPLVKIQPQGSQRPLFCVHPAGGTVFPYYHLAQYLGSDQPFYAFQALGLDGQHEPHTTVEDKAAYYIEAMRVVQPEGPYFLAGWSYGGAVAFEMASRLLAQGQQVALLALLDSGCVDKEFDLEIEPDDALLLYKVFQDLCPLSLEHLQKLTSSERLLYVAEEVRQSKLLGSDFGIIEAKLFCELLRIHNFALLRYRPKHYPVRVTLLRAAEENREVPLGPARGWDSVAGLGVDIHIVPGTHMSMMFKPNVQVLAEKLKRCLEQVQAEN